MQASDFILLLVVQIGLILGLSRIMGFLFVRFRQPQVMGEMIAGIMLGPSLFGWLMPAAFSSVFPEQSIQYLNALSQVGVIFFLFLIGLELDPKLLRNRGRAAIVISNASIIAPFLAGACLAVFLYPRLFNRVPAIPITSVALFLGAAMSVTAFPVLARILTERNLHKTQVGAIAITCAAVNDVTAWCMLAVVIAIARATGVGPGLLTAAKAVLYIFLMFILVRPFLRRLELVFERRGGLSQDLLAVILILVLASSFVTQWIGIHALFGAFLMGAIMPKGTAFVQTLTEKLQDYTVVFLLPIFFAYIGLRTQIGLLDHASLWFYTGLIILAASAGKFGGSAVAARACGLSWREASAIGILMNTRGLMELVILNIGRNLGVITEAVFAMMVIMAIVTTALTTPMLQWFYPRAIVEAEAAAAREKAAQKLFTVLIPISLPASGGPLARMAAMLSPALETGRRIIALHLQRLADRDPYSVRMSDASSQPTEALQPLLATARELDIPAEPIAFVSRDIPSDIARIARLRAADLILMGFHKPVFGQAILGGTVHRVMTASDNDVAVFVDHGIDHEIRTVLVPYLGGKHDLLALDLAGRIARNARASLTVLHVIPPRRSVTDAVLHARSIVDRTFADPTQPTPIHFQVIEDESPVDAVIRSASQHDLLVIGVEEQWGMQSQLFGFRPERIAREAATSLLIVRKYAGPVVTPTTASRPAEALATPTSR
ncbi:MAG: cation:proton antiporter [Tepidisphaeraceae bacterium]|jgi:Kef-type K+ transport system membrane component KefB